MKQTVAPLQAEEVNKLRRELASFDVRQHEFRELFRKTAPFNYDSTYPYVRIDRVSRNMFASMHIYYCVSAIPRFTNKSLRRRR